MKKHKNKPITQLQILVLVMSLLLMSACILMLRSNVTFQIGLDLTRTEIANQYNPFGMAKLPLPSLERQNWQATQTAIATP